MFVHRASSAPVLAALAGHVNNTIPAFLAAARAVDLAAVRKAVSPLLVAKEDTESMAEFERLVARVQK